MEQLRRELNDWYRVNKRDLPWRGSKDPYLIWLSEVILQQTQIRQGIPYYERFVERFPDVEALAEASELEVLKYWQGLGYYSRARNLHSAAREIVEHRTGNLPDNYDELIALPGIGPYTAAAISSIAFGEPRAAIDGNAERVFARIFGIEHAKGTGSFRNKVGRLAAELLDIQDPGGFNQAIMEFGALQCIPRNPACHSCPVRLNCIAVQKDLVNELPARQEKRAATTRYFHYLVLVLSDGKSRMTLMKKREAGDIWQHLYEFPLLESDSQLPVEEILRSHEFRAFASLSDFRVTAVFDRKHVLSHQVIMARMVMAEASFFSGLQNREYELRTVAEVSEFPVPRLIEPLIENLANSPPLP